MNRKELHTPWSDEIDLLTFADNQDAEGFGASPPKSQNEFYLSLKAGHQASASVTIQKVDYEGERFAEFSGRRFRVIRAFPASFDELTLMLEEIVR